MTYKDILESIEQVKEMPLTDKTADILANLLYIKKHWCHETHRDGMESAWDDPAEDMPMSMYMAEEWCAHMENEDGTTGPHWSMESVQQELAKRGMHCSNLAEFWAVMNAIYSDDCAVAKKHNVNTMDYYIDRAKAWLHDKDAVKDKAAAYYHYVVRH